MKRQTIFIKYSGNHLQDMTTQGLGILHWACLEKENLLVSEGEKYKFPKYLSAYLNSQQ